MKLTYGILAVFLIGFLFCVNSPAQQNYGTKSVPLIGEFGWSAKWGSAWLDLPAPINFKMDLLPSVSKSHVPKPIYFVRLSLFSRLKATSLCNNAPDHNAT